MPSIAQQPRRIALLHGPESENGDRRLLKGSRQIFGLDLPQDITSSLSKTSGASDGIYISLGKIPMIRYSTESHELDFSPPTCRHEIYSGLEAGDKQDMSFIGVVSHSAALKTVQEITANADAALAKLKQRLESAQKEKESHRATLVDEVRAGKKTLGANKRATPSHRLNMFGSSTPRSVPTSPSMNSTRPATSQSAAAVTSNPASQESSISIATAVRRPLLHLLAVRPISEEDVIKILRAPRDVCLKLLEKFGNQSEADKLWQLSDKWYMELDVWNFPYSVDADREAAVNNAIRAFDRKRLGHDDKHWDLLLPKHKRGQGIILSKLNLHTGFNPQNPPAKPSLPKADNTFSPPYQNNPSAVSPMARSKGQSVAKKRKASEVETALAEHVAVKSPAKPPPSRGTRSQSGAAKAARAGRQKKDSSKVKSAEYVNEEDLDELGDEEEQSTQAQAVTAINKPLDSQNSSKPPTVTHDLASRNVKPLPTAKQSPQTNRSKHSNSFSSETSSLSSIPSSSSPGNHGNLSRTPMKPSHEPSRDAEVKKRKLNDGSPQKSSQLSSPPLTSTSGSGGLSPAENNSTTNFNFFNKAARPIPKKRIVYNSNVNGVSHASASEIPARQHQAKRSNGSIDDNDGIMPKKIKINQQPKESALSTTKTKRSLFQENGKALKKLPDLDLLDLKERRSELQKTYIDLHIKTDEMMQKSQLTVEETMPNVDKLWAIHDELEMIKNEIERREGTQGTTNHIKAQYETEYPAYKDLWTSLSKSSKPHPADGIKALWKMHNRLRDLANLMDESARAEIIQKARSDVVISNPASPTGPLSRRQTLHLYSQYYTYYAKYEKTNAAHTALGAPDVTLADVEADWKMRIRLDDMRRDIVAGFAHMSKGLDSPNEPDEEFSPGPDLTQEEMTTCAKRYADEWPEWFAQRKNVLGAPFGSVEPAAMNDLWERQGRLKKWRWQIWRASKKFPIAQKLA